MSMAILCYFRIEYKATGHSLHFSYYYSWQLAGPMPNMRHNNVLRCRTIEIPDVKIVMPGITLLFGMCFHII